MSHIFISYSRKDLSFAERIVTTLAKDDLEPWIDWKSIPKGEELEREIQQGIEEADIFLFLVSPDSVHSKWCRREINHAVKNGKRILPITIQETDPDTVPPEISKRNWIFCRAGLDDFDGAMGEIRSTIRVDYEWLKYHTRLQVKALEWEQAQDNGRLLREKDLREAEERLSRVKAATDPRPTDLQQHYLLSSRRYVDRLRRRLIGGLFSVLVVTVFLSIIALFQRNEAVRQRGLAQSAATQVADQRDLARAGELSAQALYYSDKNPALALLLTAQAFQQKKNVQTTGSLLASLQAVPQLKQYLIGHANHVSSVAYSPNGRLLASASWDNSVIIWDVSNPDQPLRIGTLYGDGNPNHVNTVAFSPNGMILAFGTNFNIVLWNISDPANPVRVGDITGNYESIYSIAFSPDGTLLASGSTDTTVRLWDVSNQDVPRLFSVMEGHTGYVNAVAFSPDGNRLASGGMDKSLILWDVSSPENPVLLSRLTEGLDYVYSLSFSPTEDRLASGHGDGAINLWDISSASPVKLATIHESEVIHGLDFNPIGTILASTGNHNGIDLWDLEDPGNPIITSTLLGNTRIVNSVAFSPDGATLASGSQDNSVVLWDASSSASPIKDQILAGQSDTVKCVAFSPDGALLASGSRDGSIVLWGNSVPDMGNKLGLIWGQVGFAESIAFSSDGTFLAVGGQDHLVVLWDVSDPKSPQQLSTLTGHSDFIYSVAISPDRKILASSGADNDIILWDISEVHHPSLLTHINGNFDLRYALAFNPQGTLLAAGGAKMEILIWDITDARNPVQQGTLTGHSGLVDTLAFTKDGQFLVSGSWDTTIRFWDVSVPDASKLVSTITGASLVNSISLSPDGNTLVASNEDRILLWDITDLNNIQQIGTLFEKTTPIAFSPDGTLIASGNLNGNITLWSYDPDAWLKRDCRMVGRNFTLNEWSQFFPGEEYQITCPQWPSGE